MNGKTPANHLSFLLSLLTVILNDKYKKQYNK